ncbi:MAG: RNA polymerase sigma factor [Prolixibacteraceae bacterium]
MEDQLLIHIIDRCKRGERSAQTELYSRYYRGMYSVCLRILNHSAEAEDAMQDAFIAAFKNLEHFKGEVTFGSWLKRIAINRSIDLMRKRKVKYEDLSRVPDWSENDQDEYSSEMTPEMIKTAISKLNDNHRIVLTLYLLEGYDHDEISSILNISNGSSRIIYHRAKEKLKIQLKEMKPMFNTIENGSI